MVLGPTWPIPTKYLEGKPEFNHISSTLIRTLCKTSETPKEELKELVPEIIVEQVAKCYSRDQ